MHSNSNIDRFDPARKRTCHGSVLSLQGIEDNYQLLSRVAESSGYAHGFARHAHFHGLKNHGR